jgi:hypothetical protein
MSAELEDRIRHAAPSSHLAAELAAAGRAAVVQHAADRWGERAPSRRWRRSRVVLAAVALGLLLALAVTAIVARHPATTPGPTRPHPAPPRSGLSLATDPLLSTADAARLGAAVGQNDWYRTGTQPSGLHQCLMQLGDLLSTRSASATYARHGTSAETTFANEFVIAYADPRSAARAMATLRTDLAGCEPGSGRFTITDGAGSTAGPVEAEWTGRGQMWPYGSDHYRIGVARDGNVVVILETYNGLSDQTDHLLQVMLLRAIPVEYRRLCEPTTPPADACADVPAPPPVRFIGLPAPGAVASRPVTADVVASYDDTDTGSSWNLYTDGRIIWRRDGNAGYVEQRLTAAAVRMLRAKVLATGLFTKRHSSAAHDWTTLNAGTGADDLRAGVEIGGHLFRVEVAPPDDSNPQNLPLETDVDARALTRIKALLANPAASLPAGSWADRRIRTYVPSYYAIDIERAAPDPSALPLAALPPRIRTILTAVLAGKCGTLTTDQMRTLLQTFAAAGVEPADNGPAMYGFDVAGRRDNTVSWLGFWALLPNDAPPPSAAGGCG